MLSDVFASEVGAVLTLLCCPVSLAEVSSQRGKDLIVHGPLDISGCESDRNMSGNEEKNLIYM